MLRRHRLAPLAAQDVATGGIAFVEELGLGHPIGAEVTEVLPQLAPRR
jgi:hypothetical protein